jgi:hypothetical protein
MQHAEQPTDVDSAPTCRVDKTGAGCFGPTEPPSRRGLASVWPAVLGGLCIVGCLAAPIAIGGAVAFGGAVSDLGWITLAAGLGVAAALAVLVRVRRGRSLC